MYVCIYIYIYIYESEACLPSPIASVTLRYSRETRSHSNVGGEPERYQRRERDMSKRVQG